MQDSEFNFSKNIQNSILYLGIYDEDVIKHISLLINPNNFQSEYARFTSKLLIDFYTEFKKAPKDHFWDLFEQEIENKNFTDSKKNLYSSFFKKIIKAI